MEGEESGNSEKDHQAINYTPDQYIETYKEAACLKKKKTGNVQF